MHVQGIIVTDCVKLFGILPWCMTDGGGDLCAPNTTETIAAPVLVSDTTSPETIAVRDTIEGGPCRLPLVYKYVSLNICT